MPRLALSFQEHLATCNRLYEGLTGVVHRQVMRLIDASREINQRVG
jgi:hypothetical protein